MSEKDLIVIYQLLNVQQKMIQFLIEKQEQLELKIQLLEK